MAGRHAAFERGVLALAAAQVQTLGNDLAVTGDDDAGSACADVARLADWSEWHRIMHVARADVAVGRRLGAMRLVGLESESDRASMCALVPLVPPAAQAALVRGRAAVEPPDVVEDEVVGLVQGAERFLVGGRHYPLLGQVYDSFGERRVGGVDERHVDWGAAGRSAAAVGSEHLRHAAEALEGVRVALETGIPGHALERLREGQSRAWGI